MIKMLMFSKSEHLDDVIELGKMHDLSFTEEDFPELGLGVYLEETPVAFGFLRRCEGNVAIFDGLITNCKLQSAIRNEALDAITVGMIRLAMAMNIKRIIGWVEDKNTIERSIKHGFSCHEHQKLISLSLLRS